MTNPAHPPPRPSFPAPPQRPYRARLAIITIAAALAIITTAAPHHQTPPTETEPMPFHYPDTNSPDNVADNKPAFPTAAGDPGWFAEAQNANPATTLSARFFNQLINNFRGVFKWRFNETGGYTVNSFVESDDHILAEAIIQHTSARFHIEAGADPGSSHYAWTIQGKSFRIPLGAIWRNRSNDNLWTLVEAPPPMGDTNNNTARWLRLGLHSEHATTTTHGTARSATAAEATNRITDQDVFVRPSLVENAVRQATTTINGKISIATQAEANALSSTTHALTPGRLPTASESQRGIVELASATQAATRQHGYALQPADTTAAVLPATTTTAGKVERATDAEAAAGTDTTRYVTPAHLLKREVLIDNLSLNVSNPQASTSLPSGKSFAGAKFIGIVTTNISHLGGINEQIISIAEWETNIQIWASSGANSAIRVRRDTNTSFRVTYSEGSNRLRALNKYY